MFWYTLHLVFVHRNRRNEIGDELLKSVSEMIEKSSQAKGYLLSEAGVMQPVYWLRTSPFIIERFCLLGWQLRFPGPIRLR